MLKEFISYKINVEENLYKLYFYFPLLKKSFEWKKSF